MSKPFTFDMLFLWDKNDPLSNLEVISHVILANVQTQNYKGVGEKIVLTNRCVTFRELEWEIEKLHRELEQVKENGRQHFAALDDFRNSKTA